jgi:hypothetical protein
MRVRFNNSIYSCTKVSHTPESKLLLITTTNGVYTVDMITSKSAELAYYQILTKGYCDFSKYEYQN